MQLDKENNKSNDEQYIFEKEVVCPVCGVTFKTPVVKTTAYRVIGKDSDLYVKYSLINPYFYDVWLCNECGYAAMKSDFEKIKKRDVEPIIKEISVKWNRRYYPNVFDVNIAIERYKLAVLTSSTVKSKASKLGMNFLKLAWMYRIIEDTKNEQTFLNLALKEFNEAYFSEDFPIYGMDKFTTMYLIGELNRRIGNDKEALLQFSNVITNSSAGRKIKDLAITQKDLIKSNSSVEDEATDSSDATENVETENKKKGLFSKFFK